MIEPGPFEVRIGDAATEDRVRQLVGQRKPRGKFVFLELEELAAVMPIPRDVRADFVEAQGFGLHPCFAVYPQPDGPVLVRPTVDLGDSLDRT